MILYVILTKNFRYKVLTLKNFLVYLYHIHVQKQAKMKHSIFVSVQEYLENGGTLHHEQILHTRNVATRIITPSGWYDETIEHDIVNGIIIVTTHSRSFQMHWDILFVEIPVNPIYVPYGK